MKAKSKNKFIVQYLIIIAFLLMINPGVWARVSGECSNCHTMHNSQNGEPLKSGPNPYLLDPEEGDPCVACHSSSGSDTIENGIPKVLNFQEPTSPLAGGNFYWVVNKGDVYGHNVLAIDGVNEDANFISTGVPGAPVSGGQCAVCHDKVTYCYSCHTPQHHKNDHPNGVYTNVVGSGATEGCYYRFLGPASQRVGLSGLPDISWHNNPGVKGIEDPNWEQHPTSTNHNEYAGETSKPSQFGGGYESISDFCAGCHAKFYNSSFYKYSNDGTTSSPWHRHPVDTKFSEVSGTEYIYNTPDGTNFGPYNPLVPIARPNIDSYDGKGSSSIVTANDQVQCLSCHRAHGSPYPDMLRWDYLSACNAGVANDECGCFICHTSKD